MIRFITPCLNLSNPHYESLDAEILNATPPYQLSDGEKVIWAIDLRLGLQYGSSYLEFNYPVYGAGTIMSLTAKTLRNFNNVPIKLFYDKRNLKDLTNVKGFILK